ncbi:hypothetical protein PG991_006544 [Apiospora marii]|uniref:Uncharacterized protein n=1 Tax=Apiospora marii TaxID=335849 RepID=A0ABR1RZF8_9PEZI
MLTGRRIAENPPQIKWSPRIQPKIGHYPDYREHAFEKYNRVLALVRGCAQEMFKLARLSNRHDQTDLRHLGAATEEYRRLADEYKHTTIKAFYFCEQLMPQLGDDSDFSDRDRNRWVRASDRPAWMRDGGGVDWESYVPENLRD